MSGLRGMALLVLSLCWACSSKSTNPADPAAGGSAGAGACSGFTGGAGGGAGVDAGPTFCGDGGLKCHGSACTSPNECFTGLCVDGVCCNSACSMSCRNCRFTDNPNGPGFCGFAPACTDPREDCPGSLVCNGSGECLK